MHEHASSASNGEDRCFIGVFTNPTGWSGVRIPEALATQFRRSDGFDSSSLMEFMSFGKHFDHVEDCLIWMHELLLFHSKLRTDEAFREKTAREELRRRRHWPKWIKRLMAEAAGLTDEEEDPRACRRD